MRKIPNYLIENKDLMQEWNYKKNKEIGLDPEKLTSGSNKNAWWSCKNGHEWQAVIYSRYNGNGCPYCAGRKAIKGINDLESRCPELLKDWDYSKNVFMPDEVTWCSSSRAWWKCNKCGYEWKSIISNRSNLHRGCPICSKEKQKKNQHNSLLKTRGSLEDNYPEIAQEWHPTKNGLLLPNDIASGSIKSVWWLGKCGHEWKATVGNRTNKKSGCPYCAGIKAIKGITDLKTKNPEIALEWNYEKNLGLRPDEVTASSNKKVWWKCKKCGYEWESVISNRSSLHRGCPICSKEKQKKNQHNSLLKTRGSLEETNPELAKEWHPTKNGELTPKDVLAGNSDKVWWLLPYDDPRTGKHFDFEWESTIASRNAGVGCPFLEGRCWTGFNDITVTNPEVLKYWDYSKNKSNPNTLTKGTRKKVWWICEYGHSFKSELASQCKRFSCPVCTKEQRTSFPEQAIFYYIRQIALDTVNGDKTALNGLELDIYIPSKRIGIEYDGAAWHKDLNKDLKKGTECKKKGIKLIRIREEGCKDYEDGSVKIYTYKYGDWESLDKIIIEICEYITDKKINISIDRDIHKIEEMYLTNKKNNSAAISNPELLKLWHPSKNGNLTLYHFDRCSEKLVWWKDSYNHEYRKSIKEMTLGGEHCPYCLNRKLLVGFNDLQTRFPDIAAEWDYEKNGEITPLNVIYNKGKYWFKCKTCGNEWQAYLVNRTREKEPTGCPTCGFRKVADIKRIKNNLSTKYPEIAKEWNYEKNGGLKPSDFSAASKKEVWWKCNKCGYEWQGIIEVRTRGYKKCKICNKKNH